MVQGTTASKDHLSHTRFLLRISLLRAFYTEQDLSWFIFSAVAIHYIYIYIYIYIYVFFVFNIKFLRL